MSNGPSRFFPLPHSISKISKFEKKRKEKSKVTANQLFPVVTARCVFSPTPDNYTSHY